jgi:hypothetical protein
MKLTERIDKAWDSVEIQSARADKCINKKMENPVWYCILTPVFVFGACAIGIAFMWGLRG